MFANIDPGRRLTVLDVGAATPESVSFFNRFQCRLYYADLFGETGYVRQHVEPRQSHETTFGRIFDFPGDTCFDICLFWDFLNYLDPPLLRDFGLSLRRHVHDDTRAHAFAAFSNVVPFQGLRFGLEDIHWLAVKSEPEPSPHPHTNKTMSQALWPFAISHATLLEGNRQELFLEVQRM